MIGAILSLEVMTNSPKIHALIGCIRKSISLDRPVLHAIDRKILRDGEGRAHTSAEVISYCDKI